MSRRRSTPTSRAAGGRPEARLVGTGRCPSADRRRRGWLQPTRGCDLPAAGWGVGGPRGRGLRERIRAQEHPRRGHLERGGQAAARQRGAPTSWGRGVGLTGDKRPVQGQQGQLLGNRNVRTALSCLRENADGNFSIVCVLPEREHRRDEWVEGRGAGARREADRPCRSGVHCGRPEDKAPAGKTLHPASVALPGQAAEAPRGMYAPAGAPAGHPWPGQHLGCAAFLTVWTSAGRGHGAVTLGPPG